MVTFTTDECKLILQIILGSNFSISGNLISPLAAIIERLNRQIAEEEKKADV